MTAGKKAKSKAVAARGRVQLVEVDPATTSTSQLKWHEQAAFHVTFNNAADQSDGSMWQTRVYHEEAGADCVRSGILAPELIDWMRERAGLPASSEAPRELPSADAEHAHVPEAAGWPRPLSLGELEVAELPSEREIGGSGIDKRLRAQLHFELAAAAAQPLVSTSYIVQLIAWAEGADEPLALASVRGALLPERSAYLAELDFAVPPIGSYQLAANVLLAEDELAGVTLGPVLTVIP